MAKLSTEELLGQFKDLTLLELSEFVKAFEEEFGVTAAAPVAVAAPGAPAAGAPAEDAPAQDAVADEAPAVQDTVEAPAEASTEETASAES